MLDGDCVVDFLMLDWDEGERTVWIWRFMIGWQHQRKGYGRQAIEAAIQLLRDSVKFDLMHLDYVPGNTVARELCHSLGFRENGDVDRLKRAVKERNIKRLTLMGETIGLAKDNTLLISNKYANRRPKRKQCPTKLELPAGGRQRRTRSRTVSFAYFSF